MIIMNNTSYLSSHNILKNGIFLFLFIFGGAHLCAQNKTFKFYIPSFSGDKIDSSFGENTPSKISWTSEVLTVDITDEGRTACAQYRETYHYNSGTGWSGHYVILAEDVTFGLYLNHAEQRFYTLMKVRGGYYYSETAWTYAWYTSESEQNLITEFGDYPTALSIFNENRNYPLCTIPYTVTEAGCESCEENGGCGCNENVGSSGDGPSLDGVGPHTFNDGSPQYYNGGGSGAQSLNLSKKWSPSINLTNPKHFVYSSSGTHNEEQLIKDNYLHQIKNDKALTQIDVIDEHSYIVSQYKISKVGPLDGDGYHTILTGQTPDKVIRFSKNDLTPNVLNIQEEKGGSVISNTMFDYNQTDEYWKLGQDINGDGSIDRYEYIDETDSGDDKVKIYIVLDGDENLISKISRKYDQYYNLVEEVIDPDGVALTKSYIYTENKLTRVNNNDGSWEAYTYNTTNGKIEIITSSSGSFTYYEYDSSNRITKKVESFNRSLYSSNDDEHKVTIYDYYAANAPYLVDGDIGFQEPNEARRVSTFLLGNPVAVTYYGYLSGEDITIRGATSTSAIDDSNNLVSKRSFETSGDFEGDTTKEENEDGITGTIYERTVDENVRTETTYSGVFNATRDAIVSGTKTEVIYEDDLEKFQFVYDIATDTLISRREVVSRDYRDRETLVEYLDNTTEVSNYNCCNLEYTISRDGVRTNYTFDALDREKTVEVNGVTRENFYDAAENIIKVEEKGTDETVRVLSQSFYNLAGQLEWTRDAANERTDYATTYVGSNTIETITFPNTKTRITTTDSEGRILSVTGTGAFHEGADLDTEFIGNDADLGYAVHVQQYGKSDNWTKTYTDALGRVFKTQTSTGAISTEFYDNSGALVKSIAATGAQTLYYNDIANNISIQALDTNHNDVIDYGTDVVTRTQSYYENDYLNTKSWINPASLANPGPEDNLRQVATDGLMTINVSNANGISSTVKSILQIISFNRFVTTTIAPDGSFTKTQITSGLQDWVKNYGNTADSLDDDAVAESEIIYGYDKYNRLDTQTDSRNGTTTYAYDNSDRVTALTTTDPDGAANPKDAQVFRTFYTEMGQRDYVVHPDGSQINFTYNDEGLIETSTGSQVYPRTYDYDEKGNLASLTTTNERGPSTLSWEYYPNGQLKKKVDAKGYETIYSYYSSGQVKSKSTSRGTKTWTYDSSGRLDTISYSDDTPTVSFTYNELGRLSTVSDGLGDRNFNYNALGQFTGNSWLSGAFSGIDQDYTYDSTGRQKTAGFTIDGITQANTYFYNNFGLLDKVQDGANEYIYTYLDQSPYTVEALEIKKGETVQMHSKRAFDKLMRTTGFEWNTGAKE